MKNLYLVDSLGFLDDSFFDYTKKRKATGVPLSLGKPTRSRGIFSVSLISTSSHLVVFNTPAASCSCCRVLATLGDIESCTNGSLLCFAALTGSRLPGSMSERLP